MITIVLADDHPLIREGLRALLQSETDIQIVGEATNGEMACEVVQQLRPDVLVLDVSMPVLNGIEVAERIGRVCPATKTVILTVHEELAYLARSLKAGAHGYVLKRSASNVLIDAVRTVATTGTYIDPAISHALATDLLIREQSAGDTEMLSPRERDVLIRIAQGFSNKEIASALTISVKTVETYKMRFATKLGLHTRVEIVRYAASRGWLSAP